MFIVRTTNAHTLPSRTARSALVWLGDVRDEQGISPNNPRCQCDIPSRMDVGGVNSLGLARERGFWTCSTGASGYHSTRRDGLTGQEAR